MEKIEELKEEIKEIIKENIFSEDPYCGVIGIEGSVEEIIDLLKNKFMVFFEQKQ